MRQTNQAIMADVDDAINVKRIANNTVRYERPNGDVVWRLHNTDIVVKHVDGTFTLNSGGWKTVTTKDRINTYAPAYLYSGDGVWYIRGGVPFYDGMKVDAGGQAIDAPAATSEAKEAKVLKAKITKFVRMIDACEELPTPSNGDCWICSMMHPEPSRNNKPSANQMNPGASGPSGDPSCLMSHIDEGYLHGSLLVNAMRWKGYSDEGISLYYYNANRFDGRFGRDVFKRALRGYLGRKLGLVIR